MQPYMTCIVLTAFQIAAASPVKKRAHYIPPRGPNITATKPPVHDDNWASVNMTVSETNTETPECPSHLVDHGQNGQTKCCIPVFNCPVGFGIKMCDNDGEKDQCIPCPPGMIQMNNVSSLNMDEAECYSMKDTENCPLDDTKAARKYSDVPSCWLKCECKNEACFSGADPCACSLGSSCAINYTMNRITGDCEPCPWYAYKDYVGCGTCTIIPELWGIRNSHPTKPVEIDKKTTKEASHVHNETGGQGIDKRTSPSTTTPGGMVVQPSPSDNSNILIGVIAAVGFLIVAILLIGILVKRRKNTGSASPLLLPADYRNRPNGSDLGLKADTEIIELPDGYETGGNRQIIAQNVARADNKYDKKKQINDMAEEELGAVGGAYLPPAEHKQEFVDFQDRFDEDTPLMKRDTRTSNVRGHIVSYPDLSPCRDSRDHYRQEQEPLLSDLRNGNTEIHANGGARPKSISKTNKRQPHGAKSESSLGSVQYKMCTFKNCKFNTTLPNCVQLISPITEYSICSNDSSYLESVDTSPKEPSDLSNRGAENDCHLICRKEGKYKSAMELRPKILKKNITEFCEHSTKDTNTSDTGEDDIGNTKHVERKFNNVSNVPFGTGQIDMEKQERTVSDENNLPFNNHNSSEADPIELKANTKNEGSEFLNNKNRKEQFGVRTGLDEVESDLNLTGVRENVSKDLLASINADESETLGELPETVSDEDLKDNAGLRQENEKEFSKEEVVGRDDHLDAIRPEQRKGNDSNPKSSDEGSDEDGTGNGVRRKIKPFNSQDNGNKPTARIEPFRQNSVEEPTMGIYSNVVPSSRNQEYNFRSNYPPRFESYTDSLASDSYAIMHIERPLSDVGNVDDLEEYTLNPSTIDSSRSSSVPEHFSVAESIETDMPQTGLERERPDGCSVSLIHGSGNYIQRPDMQRTFSKCLEEAPVDGITGNSDNSTSEETDLKSPVEVDNFTPVVKGVCITKNKGDSGTNEDEIDKLKKCKASINPDEFDQLQSSVEIDAHNRRTEEGAKDTVDESEDVENRQTDTCTQKKKTDIEASEQSDNVELTNNCILSDCVSNTERSDSVELPYNCLSSGISNTNQSDSVELPIDCLNDSISNGVDSDSVEILPENNNMGNNCDTDLEDGENRSKERL